MINFKKTNRIDGTSLKGYVEATYKEIKETLGVPDFYLGSKVVTEWALEFEDGTIATIYDWKEDATPLDIYHWHIGGHSPKAVELVGQLLGLETKGAY